MTRQDIFDKIIGKSFESQNPDTGEFSRPYITTIMWVALLAFVFYIVQCCRAYQTREDEEEELYDKLDDFWFGKPLALCGLINFVLTVVVLVEFVEAVAVTASDVSTINEGMEVINNCMDSYSQIDLAYTVGVQMDTQLTSQIYIVVVCIVFCALSVMGCMYTCCKAMKARQSELDEVSVLRNF